MSTATTYQSCVRIDDIEPATLPGLSTRLIELNETLQPISYRVVVLDVRAEFNRATVLGSIADLFRRGDEMAIDLSARMPFGRLVRDAAGAARLADLLTMAGCRCAIEIHFNAPVLDEPVRRSWHVAAWLDRLSVRIASEYEAARERFVIACGTARERIDAVCEAGRPLVRALLDSFIARWTRLRVRATQPVAVAIGVSASMGLLLVTLSGIIAPVYATRAGDATTSLVIPQPPAVEWASRTAAASMSPVTISGNEALYRAKTRLGVVTLEKNSDHAGQWNLKWNGALIRELRVASAPSIVSRQGRGKPEPAVGEFGDEVALVIDTGEPRSMFCQANKPMLLVLSRIGAAYMHDIPGDCAELETVQVDRQGMFIHFYDQAAPSVAYQGGRILRSLN